MHEDAKFVEAQYFYSRMLQEIDNREHFDFNLSAFLSASRSVLQYALEEAGTNPRGKQWYSQQISSSSVLSFFRDKRDVNIHDEPVMPAQHTTETLTCIVHLSDSISITHRDANGNVLYQSPPEIPEPEPRAIEPPSTVIIQYRFVDWAGTEDVLTLSRLYLDELRRFIDDGKRYGFLTG